MSLLTFAAIFTFHTNPRHNGEGAVPCLSLQHEKRNDISSQNMLERTSWYPRGNIICLKKKPRRVRLGPSQAPPRTARTKQKKSMQSWTPRSAWGSSRRLGWLSCWLGVVTRCVVSVSLRSVCIVVRSGSYVARCVDSWTKLATMSSETTPLKQSHLKPIPATAE